MIAYHFPPGEEIGGRRPFRLLKYLERMGFACHVITASQPAGPTPSGVIWVPDKLASFWDHSSDAKLSFNGGIEGMARKFLFPGHLGLTWSVEVARRCRQIMRDHPDDRFVMFSTYPPLGVLLAGLLIRLRTGTPWISDFRDPLNIDADAVHISREQRYLNYLVERWIFRKADCIIANTQDAADMLAARYPWADGKLRVIWNGFDPEASPEARPLPPRKERTIVHAGALYLGRNPNIIVESMSRLWRSGSEQARQTCLVLVGFIDVGKSGMKQEIHAPGTREGWLRLIPPVARAEAQRMTEEADGLLLLQPQSKVQVPGKLFEYICIGRPILALVPQQSAVEFILSQAGVPYVCIYTDDGPATVDQKLLTYLSLPPNPVPYSEWFGANFNAQQQAKQLVSIINAVAVGKPKPSNQFVQVD
jgi:glycosyltransferase involved in cell wall biosynthesis